MCGIFGYVSNNINKIDINAFKILGILNETRGAQSCGVHVDAEILHGVTANDKLFRDFLIGTDLTPKDKPVLFGHTRKASSGVVNMYNAHPFGFGTNKTNQGYEFIGVHNGTIYNDTELAKEFGVKTDYIVDNVSRVKIDSELLLESIYVSKSFKPLSKYNGGAALAWYTPDDDCFYLFSGESKDYSTSHYTSIERPLHVYIIDDNTFAFSSEKEPLMVIGASKDDVFQIKTNTVYQIKDGNFKGAVEHSISRVTNTNKRTVTTSSNRLPQSTTSRQHSHLGAAYSNNTQKGSKAYYETSEKTTYKAEDGKIVTVYKPKEPISLVNNRKRSFLSTTTSSNIFTDINLLRGRVYVDDLVYKRNGHPLETGAYMYVKGYGLTYVSKSIIDFDNFMAKNRQNWFDIVEGSIVETLDISQMTEDRYVPFNSLFQKPYCIYKGYLLDTVTDYLAVISNESIIMTNNKIDYLKLSYMTRYPVKNITYFESNVSNNTYYKYVKDGDLVEETTFGGPCFDCIYTIRRGSFVKQEEFVKNHLLGLDLLHRKEYEDALGKYEEAKKLAEKQKAEESKNNLDFKQEINKTINRLRNFGKEMEPICPTVFSKEELLVGEIVDEMLTIYEDYEDNAFMTKTDIDNYNLGQDLLDVLNKLSPDDDEILEPVINELEEISKNIGKRRHLAAGLLKQITNY